jgi:Mrp family chromosome partitioning ATPase
VQLTLELDVEERPRCVMVTSPATSRAAYLATLAFAHSLSAEGARVLLVDASFHGPDGLRKVVGGNPETGFLNVLDGAAERVKEFIVPTDDEGVSFLSSGMSSESALTLITEERIKAFRELLARDYDWVLLSCRPVIDDSIALALPRLVDCVIIVATEGSTRIDRLDETKDALDRAGARRVGMVLTRRRRWFRFGRRG